MANFIGLISSNINESQNPVKWKKCVTPNKQANVAFIQETHLNDSVVITFKTD